MSHESEYDSLLSDAREDDVSLLPLDDQESIEFHLRGGRVWTFRRKRFIITASVITVVANLMFYISLPSFTGKKEIFFRNIVSMFCFDMHHGIRSINTCC